VSRDARENNSKGEGWGPMIMDDRTAGPDWSGPVRGPDFWSEILFGPVRGPDFGPDFYLVRYVVRNSVRKSAPGRIIRPGPDFGPDFKTDGNSEKKILNESLIIIEKIRTNFRTGPS